MRRGWKERERGENMDEEIKRMRMGWKRQERNRK